MNEKLRVNTRYKGFYTWGQNRKDRNNPHRDIFVFDSVRQRITPHYKQIILQRAYEVSPYTVIPEYPYVGIPLRPATLTICSLDNGKYIYKIEGDGFSYGAIADTIEDLPLIII